MTTETAGGALPRTQPSALSQASAFARGIWARAHAAATHPKTQETLAAAGRRCGSALRHGATLAKQGASAAGQAAAPMLDKAGERLGLRTRFAERTAEMRARYSDYRRERELDQLAATLDGLTDRQLAILGFDRGYLYTDLEARAEAFDAQKDTTDEPTQSKLHLNPT